MAGANAALSAQNKPSFTLDREKLYRRADRRPHYQKAPTSLPHVHKPSGNRLELRHDNADQRLTPRGLQQAWSAQLVAAFETKLSLVHTCRAVARDNKLNGIPISQLLKRPILAIWVFHRNPLARS